MSLKGGNNLESNLSSIYECKGNKTSLQEDPQLSLQVPFIVNSS